MRNGMTLGPEPTAVITMVSFMLSTMVFMKAMQKKRDTMGMNLTHRPSILPMITWKLFLAEASKPPLCCAVSLRSSSSCRGRNKQEGS